MSQKRISLKEDWLSAIGEMKERFKCLFRSKALFYWVFLIFVLGGLGTWITLFLFHADKVHNADVVIAGGSYGIALGMTALADALLDRESRPLGRLLVLIAMLGSLTPVFFATMSLAIDKTPAEVTDAKVLLWQLLPAVVWGLANGKDPRFEADPPPPEAAAGGDPMQDLGGGHAGG